jgi:hypothetical protein
VLLRIWFISLAILLMIGCSLGDSKEYLKGAITVDKMNSNGEIEAITFHFKDFPYDITTGCHLSSKNVDKEYDGPKRTAYQSNEGYWNEDINLCDRDSPFAGEIQNYSHSIERSEYINSLVGFCSRFSSGYSAYSPFNQLARANTTTAITFYPKIIDGKTCTVIEYTGLMDANIESNYYDKPTNVVGLFMPLNETQDGCDRYLILASGNQTADWLDSVKVSKINKITPIQGRGQG